jgi:hypothetical protein
MEPTISASATPTLAPTVTPTNTPVPIDRESVRTLSYAGMVGNGSLLDVYFSPDNSLLIASFSFSILVMDPTSLDILCQIHSPVEIGFSAITKDNKTLVAGSTDTIKAYQDQPGAVFTWDVTSCSLKNEDKNLEEYPYYFTNVIPDQITSFAFRPNSEKEPYVLEFRDPITLQITSKQDSWSDGILDYSASSNHLMFGMGGSVDIFDKNDSLSRPIFSSFGESGNDIANAYNSLSPDGSRVAIFEIAADPNKPGKYTELLNVWNVENNELMYQTSSEFCAIHPSFLSDYKLAISYCDHYELVDIDTSSIIFSEDYNFRATSHLIRKVPNSSNFVLATDNGTRVTFTLREISNGHILQTQSIPSYDRGIRAEQWSNFLHYGNEPTEQDIKNLNSYFLKKFKIIFNFSLLDQNEVPESFSLPEEFFESEELAFTRLLLLSPKGQFLTVVFRTNDGIDHLMLFRSGNKEPLVSESVYNNSRKWMLPVISENEKYFSIATSTDFWDAEPNTTVKTWDLSDLSVQNEISLPTMMTALIISDDGLLFMANYQPPNCFVIWDVTNGNQLFQTNLACGSDSILISDDRSMIALFKTSFYTFGYNNGDKLVFTVFKVD